MNCTTKRDCSAIWGFLLGISGNDTIESRKDTSPNAEDKKCDRAQRVHGCEKRIDQEPVSPDDFEWVGLGVQFPTRK